MALAAPGVAAADALDGEPGAAEGAVGLEGFDGVVRAGGVKAADGAAAHEGDEGGESVLVEANYQDEKDAHGWRRSRI